MSCEAKDYRTWTDLLPYVIPYVRGVPEELAVHHIRLAAIEFCRRTDLLRRLNIFDVQEGVTDYFFEVDNCYVPVRVLNVCFDKHKYFPKSGESCCHVGCHTFWLDDPCSINISKPPQKDIAGGLEVTISIAPSQDACVFDEYLYQEWAEVIAHGALERIFTIPDTNWFNQNLAVMYRDKFRVGIGHGRNKNFLRHASGPMMMQGEAWV